MTPFWVVCAFFAMVIVAGIVAEGGSQTPVVSPPVASVVQPTPVQLTPSRVDYPLDAPPPVPSPPAPTADTPAPILVSATPYPTPYPMPTHTSVRPTVQTATPAPKIARTYLWRNAEYAIPRDRLSDFNAIKNAGLAKLNAVEKINKQLDSLPSQIARASGREKARLLQVEAELRNASESDLQTYEEITRRMDDFLERLVADYPECFLSRR